MSTETITQRQAARRLAALIGSFVRKAESPDVSCGNYWAAMLTRVGRGLSADEAPIVSVTKLMNEGLDKLLWVFESDDDLAATDREVCGFAAYAALELLSHTEFARVAFIGLTGPHITWLVDLCALLCDDDDRVELNRLAAEGCKIVAAQENLAHYVTRAVLEAGGRIELM